MEKEIAETVKEDLRDLVKNLVEDRSKPWANRYEYPAEIGANELACIKAYLLGLYAANTITEEQATKIINATQELQKKCGWYNTDMDRKKQTDVVLKLIEEL